MRKAKYTIKTTSQFRKDYKQAIKRGLNIALIDEMIVKLSNGEMLPDSCRDHELKGKWKGYRESHISPDWLLTYYVNHSVLVLTLVRTGTHSELFKM